MMGVKTLCRNDACNVGLNGSALVSLSEGGPCIHIAARREIHLPPCYYRRCTAGEAAK